MLNYLLELRKRAFIVIAFFISLFIVYFFCANQLFQFVVQPLIRALPNHNSLIAIQITSPVLTPIKLAANAALLSTAPFALIHLWLFITPGLYRHEKQYLTRSIIFSLFLFLLGLLFCFFIVLPFMFHFFVQSVPNDVQLMPDINSSLDFIIRMLLIFGFCFQMPLICMLLVRLQWATLASLRQMRPYFIVSAFTIGMLLTPPDVLSQIMLAIPLCLLYELGLLLAYVSRANKTLGT